MLNFYRNLHFYTPGERLPEKSGRVLVYCRDGQSFAAVDYSTKHKRFNASDAEETPKYSFNVTYWSECPKMPGEAEEEQ